MNLLYHFGLYIFRFLLLLAAPFNIRANKWIAGRKGLFRQIGSDLATNEKRIWFHAASLGEFEQGRPIIEEIKIRWPHYKIVLTFFSPSGYEIRKDYEFADYVFYLPLDTKHNAVRFINLVKPELVFFIKYEFWHNFLYTLKRNNIPSFLVSAIFRENQVFFKPWGKWYRNMIGCFSHIFVQNGESQQILNKFGFINTSLSGDTRFDRVSQIAGATKKIPAADLFSRDNFTIIIGSSWKADEEKLFSYINQNPQNIKFIIAPHEIHESNIQRIMASIKLDMVRFSKANDEMLVKAKVLIIDNIGILSSIYQYGRIAFIGGGFGSGIHNVLEASTFGLPVLFGPNYKKYQEAVDLVKSGGAFEVKNANDAGKILAQLVQDKDLLAKASQISRQYVQENKGACKKIIDFLETEVLKKHMQ